VTELNQKLIGECYRLARSAVAGGNHPFGALLALDGKVIFAAENSVLSDRDPTRHAELNLISRAVRELGLDLVRQSTLYTSTEPCVMCCGAIYWAEIRTVIYGCSADGLREVSGETFLVPSQDILERGRRPIRVVGPVLQDEGLAIHRAYWT
jgi:tRNA(Arg) A34 adenosine deaminase TadA